MLDKSLGQPGLSLWDSQKALLSDHVKGFHLRVPLRHLGLVGGFKAALPAACIKKTHAHTRNESVFPVSHSLSLASSLLSVSFSNYLNPVW